MFCCISCGKSWVMEQSFERRHSRWYEVVVFSALFQFVVGFLFVVVLPNWLRWGSAVAEWPMPEVQLNTLASNSIAFVFAFFVLRKLRPFPGTSSLSFILPSVIFSWMAVFAVLLFLREETYARQVLFASFVLALIWAFAGSLLAKRYQRWKLAVVPFGRALELKESSAAMVTMLESPSLEGRRYDGVVADLHARELAGDWERFLAECALAQIPVFHTQQLIESLTGRVKVEHLSENIFGHLQPSSFYSGVKRFLESCLVLAAVPVWLPVMLVTGVIIKLESDGAMFFIQERVGKGNKSFKVYKLRSMCKDSEKDGAQFASSNDMRITRVGHFIRKTRLDEIPQFINVLKGDMSLIGPRPEQRVFVDQFESEIPFYAYRHVVRPGITGWAQVTHGYAADADDTRIKIEHDFYYIKNFSMWLDTLIFAKTVKTIFTGFGAR